MNNLPDDRTEATPHATPHALIGKRVLVVEDNGFLCCVLEDTLRGAGCEVVGPFAVLREAMSSVASSAQIDVALLDINLRGELVSPLARELEVRGVPFLLTSAYRAGEIPRPLQSAQHLRKPYTDTDLLEGLAAIVGHSSRNN